MDSFLFVNPSAFQVLYVFLGLNGQQFEAPEPEVVRIMQNVASGEFGEEELAAWIRAHN